MEAIARLRGLSISARKVNLLASLIRGKSVSISLTILQQRKQQVAVQLKTLLLSAISNWQDCNKASLEVAGMVVKRVTVDRAGMLKRIMPAPRGVGHRIRKRSSHVAIVVDSLGDSALNSFKDKNISVK